jgi:pre-mRNA branch site protein p14
MNVRTFYGVPIVALSPDVSRVLFVSNLDASVTGDLLYRVFHKFGALRQVRVGSTPETANTAFVVYESVFDAQRAQERLHGFAPPGAKAGATRPLAVRFYNEKRHAAANERKRRRRDQLEELGRRQRELAAGSGAAASGAPDASAGPADAPVAPANAAA